MVELEQKAGHFYRRVGIEKENHDISYTVYILQFILLRSLSFQEENERNIAIPFWLLFPQFFICCH